VLAKVESVAENEVTERAKLQAYISLLNFLNQVGEERELEPMTNALGVQQDRVVDVLQRGVVSLSSVHVTLHS